MYSKNSRNGKRNNQWGNIQVIRTKRGILLVDNKNPDTKKFFLNEDLKKNNRKKKGA